MSSAKKVAYSLKEWLECTAEETNDLWLHSVTSQGKCETIGYLQCIREQGETKYTLLNSNKEEAIPLVLSDEYSWKMEWTDEHKCPCGVPHYILKMKVIKDTSGTQVTGTYKKYVGKRYYTREVHLNHLPNTAPKRD